jgi:tetratricopeptide (TPR) repeat protein
MAIGCPDPHLLVRLGTPAVGDATYEVYEKHVESCEVCQAVLRNFIDDGLDLATSPTSKITAPDEFPRIPGFAIERYLGRGAAGVVYLARQDEVGRHVALKLVPGGHAAGGRERRRWLREAAAAAKVRHTHVVTLYDFGEAAPWSYLALEFIPGGTLKSRLKGPLPAQAAARLVEMIARAVQKIHEDGFYHLDLKPSNILLDGDEFMSWDQVSPKVSDFGIARLVGEATMSLSAAGPLGTPAYMAPEQAGMANCPIGAASDVYALGAILYELLSGKPPIQRISIVETLDAICHQEPISPRRLNPAISLDLETICLKCLRKEPGQRYANPKILADDLRRYLEHRPIQARPISPAEYAWRWCRRNPVVAGLGAVFALTAVCGVVILLLLLNEARAERRHAEASYRIASDALTDALSLNGFVVEGAPKRDEAYVFRWLSDLGRRQQELLQMRPGDPVAGIQLVRINMALADRLIQRHNFVGASPIIEECLGILAGLVTDAQSGSEVHFEEVRCHWRLSGICSHQRRFDHALSHGLKSCQVLRTFDAALLTDERLDLAVMCHVQVGQILSFKLDRVSEAKDWLKGHERWLDALASRETRRPSSLWIHSMWLLASENKEKALAFVRLGVRSHPKDVELARILAEQLVDAAERIPSDARRTAFLDEARAALTSVLEVAAERVATDPQNIDTLYMFAHVNQTLCYCLVQLGLLDDANEVFRRLVSAQKSLNPRQGSDPGVTTDFWREITRTILTVSPFSAGAQSSADFVRSKLKEMGFQPQSEGEFGLSTILAEGDLAALMRRLGKETDAKRQVAQIVKYANELVARYPGDSFAYLALSQARIQVFKNAERYQDANSKTALRQALDAAEKATALNPGNATAQDALTDCRRRLETARPDS